MNFKLTASLNKSLFINQKILQLILKYFGIPHLGSRIRLKLISKILNSYKLPINILDAGCGYGFITKMLAKKGFLVTGVDNNQQRLSIAKHIGTGSNVKFIKASLYNLPFKDKSFDLVICFEVLEHLKDDLAVLKELKRVTKNNGKIIISFPEAGANKIGYENFGHLRPGYSIEEFKALANKLGLKIDQFISYGKSILGKTALEIDYQLARISLVFSSILFPFLYPLIIFDQFFPSKNPWNYVVILSRR